MGAVQAARPKRIAESSQDVGGERVTRAAWLGFSIAAGQDLVIALVAPGSPAAVSGLQPGDVILRLGTVRATPHALNSMVERIRAGDTLHLEVSRDGRVRQMQLVAAAAVATVRGGAASRERDASDDRLALCGESWLKGVLDDVANPPAAGRDPAARPVRPGKRTAIANQAELARRCALSARPTPDTLGGALLQHITPAMAPYVAEARTGVLVLGLRPGGAAYRAGLRNGDIIVEAFGRAVSTSSMLRERIRESSQPDVPVVVVRAGKRLQFLWSPGSR